MKFFLMASIVLVGAFFMIPGHALALEVTFVEAWHMLLQNNEGLAAQRAGLERAGLLVDANKGRRLPTVDLTGSYTRLNDPVTLAPSDLLASMPGGSELDGVFNELGNLMGIPAGAVDHALTSTLMEDDVWNASLRALWPLFTGGRISAAVNIAEA